MKKMKKFETFEDEKMNINKTNDHAEFHCKRLLNSDLHIEQKSFFLQLAKKHYNLQGPAWDDIVKQWQSMINNTTYGTFINNKK